MGQGNVAGRKSRRLEILIRSAEVFGSQRIPAFLIGIWRRLALHLGDRFLDGLDPGRFPFGDVARRGPRFVEDSLFGELDAVLSERGGF
jgi:hypothetical protein